MSSDVHAVLAGERQWTIATGDALTLLRAMPVPIRVPSRTLTFRGHTGSYRRASWPAGWG